MKNERREPFCTIISRCAFDVLATAPGSDNYILPMRLQFNNKMHIINLSIISYIVKGNPING